MNLILYALFSIYKYGNFQIHLFRENMNIKYYVDETGKLQIKTITNRDDYETRCSFNPSFNNDKINFEIRLQLKTGIEDNPEKNFPDLIAYLVYYYIYYRVNSSERQPLNEIITTYVNEEECLPESRTLGAVNEFYRYLLPMLSVNLSYIDILSPIFSYEGIVRKYRHNLSFTTLPTTDYDFQTIKNSIGRKTNHFIALLAKLNAAHNNNDDHQLDKLRNDILNSQLSGDSQEPINNNQLSELSKLNIPHEIITNRRFDYDPSIGRDEEIKNLAAALLTPQKSPILIGPPGVGKTSIVEGLAYRINTGIAPRALNGRCILKISTSDIVSGCSFVGQIEEKMQKIILFLINNPNFILFIDEFHTTIGAGTGNKSNMDVANMLKPYLSSGQIKIIAATTTEEYAAYMEKDPAYERRFIKVPVCEPTVDTLRAIINSNILKYMQQTNVNWAFNETKTDIIINHLIMVTRKKRRSKNNNPDLVLSIIARSFGFAASEDKKAVTLNDIAEAINCCEDLYPSSRKDAAESLLNILDEHDHHQERKIIPFRPKKQASV